MRGIRPPVLEEPPGLLALLALGRLLGLIHDVDHLALALGQSAEGMLADCGLEGWAVGVGHVVPIQDIMTMIVCR